jgi:hypothetical protein
MTAPGFWTLNLPSLRAVRVLDAATLLPVVGLHPAQRQWGWREQRGCVSRRQNAAKVVAEDSMKVIATKIAELVALDDEFVTVRSN